MVWQPCTQTPGAKRPFASFTRAGSDANHQPAPKAPRLPPPVVDTEEAQVREEIEEELPKDRPFQSFQRAPHVPPEAASASSEDALRPVRPGLAAADRADAPAPKDRTLEKLLAATGLKEDKATKLLAHTGKHRLHLYSAPQPLLANCRTPLTPCTMRRRCRALQTVPALRLHCTNVAGSA